MTTIHIPDDTGARLRQAAQDEGRTLDELAGEGLAAYLASRAKPEALRTAIDEGDTSGVAEDSSLDSSGTLPDRAREPGARGCQDPLGDGRPGEQGWFEAGALARVAVGNTVVAANEAGRYVAHVTTRGVLRVRATDYVQDDDEKCDSDATRLAEISLNGTHDYRADLELERNCW
jgi:hypothetical protein